ncbi:phosphoglucan phosphatase LSF2, chloroplastic isoform X2 [Neltuma alba]|nr:phosphoglucan phosphatase LSF2, chloroplastic isoform X2 [Prosopis alba]
MTDLMEMVVYTVSEKFSSVWKYSYSSAAFSTDRMITHVKIFFALVSTSQAIDFDPNSLRNELPKAVSSLEWAVSEGKGRVYVHCTAGLGRAPAVAIAYLFWFCDMNLNAAYDMLTAKRPCGPNIRAIRGATYDLAKNDPWKEPFESLPEYAFEDVADWERDLIQNRVRSLRGT